MIEFHKSPVNKYAIEILNKDMLPVERHWFGTEWEMEEFCTPLEPWLKHASVRRIAIIEKKEEKKRIWVL